MSLQLTSAEKIYLMELKARGALANVEPNRMDLSKGAIVIPCGDGDQMDDLFLHLHDICKGELHEARMHFLSLNGGAMILSGKWPYKEDEKVMIRHLLFARERKEIDTVILMSHAPCGMAREFNYDLYEVLDRLVSAQERIETLHHSLSVHSFFHVDWHDEMESIKHKRRTYRVAKENWLAVQKPLVYPTHSVNGF